MVHGHFLRKAGVVWGHAVESPFDDQVVQHSILPGEPTRSFLHPPSRLHAYDKQEILEVKILGGIPIPLVAVGIVNAHHKHLGSRVWYGNHTSGVTGADVGIAGGREDRTVVVRSGDKVAVVDITRHGKDEGGMLGL